MLKESTIEQFTPTPEQQAFMDAARGIRVNGTTVAELLDMASNLTFAVDQLMKQGGVGYDAAVDVFGVIAKNLGIVSTLTEGGDVKELFGATVQ